MKRKRLPVLELAFLCQEVSKMTVTDLLNQIKKNLREKRLEIAESLIQGRVSDFESYQKNVGIAEGLEQASEIIGETLKKLEEDD